MSKLVVAALLILLVGAAHSTLGERYILIRLFRRTDLPRLFGGEDFTRRTLRMAWHLTTVVWWGVGALLLVVAGAGPTVPVSLVGVVLAATCLASALVSLVLARGRHLSWVAFLAIAALTWLGTR